VIIASSPLLFKALAVSGALYLAWLGVHGLRGESALEIGACERSNPARACRDAIFCNVLNPKVIMLFLALYPNFLDLGRGSIALQVASLSVVLLVINAIWQVALVVGSVWARRRLLRLEVQRGVSRVTGGILIAFAGAMLWEHLG
jgi:threonine/homoserine/homoserine lactone efflux protein